MDWNQGYSANYIVSEVDPATWRDRAPIDITGGSISKSTDGMMESADVDTTQNLGEKWVRIWLYARQGDDGDRAALFTGLLQTPGVSWDGTRDSYSAECYSVLKPAADILLPRGYYVLGGTNGAKAVARLLSVSPAPVEYEDTAPALMETLVAEDSETNLSMAWKVLNAIGWRIRITGKGIIQLKPQPLTVQMRFDSRENDIIEPSVKDTQDLYSCPNVFRATSGDLTAIAKDEDDNSPLSIKARGREIWAQDTNAALNNGESVAEYARRRLGELQSPARQINYSRRFLPDLYPGDIVLIRNAEQGINGEFRITEQKIELGYSARTDENVVQTRDVKRPERIIQTGDTRGVVDYGQVGFAIVGKETA